MKKTSEPQDVEIGDFVTYRMARLNTRLNVDAARVLQETGSLGLVQWRIIVLLVVHAPTTSAVLARESGMDAGLLSRNLKRLIDDGLVVAKADADDQRRHLLSLTRRGRRVYARTMPAMRTRQERLLRGISERQRRALIATMDTLSRNALTSKE